MRERLIELLRLPSNCMPHAKCEKCGLNGGCSVQRQADKLLANGVIVPPCKVGEVVYFIQRNGGRPIGIIDEIEIVQIAQRKDGFNAKGRFKGNLNEFEIRSFKIDNYSFFLTKEEAEAALKGGAK